MKALTIWQPWATLIAEGHKPFEFRGWPAPASRIGQRIAIHAGTRSEKRDEMEALIDRLGDHRTAPATGLHSWDACRGLLYRFIANPGSLPRSSIVCTAILGRPIRNNELSAALGLPLINDSDRDEHSNWGWPLTEIRRLEPPVPAKGMQGFWNWNENHG